MDESRATASNPPVAVPSPAAPISSTPARDTASKASPIASAEAIPAPIVAAAGAEAPPAETLAPLPTTVASGIPPVPVEDHKVEVPPAALPASVLPPPAPPAPVWKDGTYTGWGYSRHGDIEAAVVIEGGRIASATISQCRTRYSCSVIDSLPPEVPQRQSPDVDYVSGATQSADAFYGAVVAALAKAK